LKYNARRYFFIFLMFASCVSQKSDMSKIKFDITRLDHNGLLGPDSGKVSLSYEFCIPNKLMFKEQISRIDPTIECSNSPGIIRCTKNEYLCIGHTNMNFKSILKQLAQLEFIESIEQSFFE
jgi:hypothetical protein